MPVQRQRLRELYQRAKADDAFLDYYAASNDAEYFGQGVEAFVSFGKAPGQETTHGHTRSSCCASIRRCTRSCRRWSASIRYATNCGANRCWSPPPESRCAAGAGPTRSPRSARWRRARHARGSNRASGGRHCWAGRTDACVAVGRA